MQADYVGLSWACACCAENSHLCPYPSEVHANPAHSPCRVLLILMVNQMGRMRGYDLRHPQLGAACPCQTTCFCHARPIRMACCDRAGTCWHSQVQWTGCASATVCSCPCSSPVGPTIWGTAALRGLRSRALMGASSSGAQGLPCPSTTPLTTGKLPHFFVGLLCNTVGASFGW